MAQETKTLLRSLIEAYDIPTSDASLQESLLQLLSNDSSGRTNQFEIHARLDGLVEKAWITNNGPLGDALQLRLKELPKVSNRWTPDVLSFLLALSDRPLEKTRVEDLASLSPGPPTPPLTWDAIIEDDPLEDQTAVWRDVDFAADGSDEDVDVFSQPSRNSEDFEAIEIFETDDAEPNLEALVVANENETLEDISVAQAWRKDFARSTDQGSVEDGNAIEVIEINAIREIIFMLLGLPSSIFSKDKGGSFRHTRRVKILHTSPESTMHLIASFLDLGQKLSAIREWVKQEFDIPLEQSFQVALGTRMMLFHSKLHNLQKQTFDQSCPIIVSIIGVFNEVNTSSRLLMQLYDMLMLVKEVSASKRPFMMLEVLYKQTCINQKVGDDEGYEYMATIFFQCFQVYLRPIQEWMEMGTADSHNPVMFIEKTNEIVAPHLFWHDQYRLIRNANGTLKAPQFLHVAGNRIFTAGKSVVFFNMLGIENLTQDERPKSDVVMSYESVCSAIDPRNLIPFSELFGVAFARWIASKQSSSTLLLRQRLESHCGLSKALMALEYIYLYSNAAVSNNAVRPLFSKIEKGFLRWNDAFSTTESFRDAFATLDCIDVDRIFARPNASKHKSNIKERSMGVLERLQISYMLPWPIANIVTSQSMAIYQRIFIFLTQLERSRFLLQREKLPLQAPRSLYSIHTNLLWFVNTLLNHLTTLVIAGSTKALHQDMAGAEDIDAMIAVHQAHISKLEDQCLLAQKHATLLRAVVSILDLTVVFSNLQAPNASQRQSQKKGRSQSFSSSEGEQDDDHVAVSSHRAAKPERDVEYTSAERLVSIQNTYEQLLAIVAASVENIRKATGGPVWTILAGHLAFRAPT